jgi:hypothetical protein
MASTDTLFALTPLGSTPTASNPATLDFIQDASTPGTQTPVLDYDPTTQEHADWRVTVPSQYAGGGFTISWKGGTSNTSTGTLELEVRCITVADATILTSDLGIDGATAAPITDTPPATPQNRLNYSTTATLSHANVGSPSVGDELIIRASRDVATDTNTGDLRLAKILILET